MNGWAKAGALDRLFEQMQHQQLIRIKIEAVSLDCTIVKVHPDALTSPLVVYEGFVYSDPAFSRYR